MAGMAELKIHFTFLRVGAFFLGGIINKDEHVQGILGLQYFLHGMSILQCVHNIIYSEEESGLGTVDNQHVAQVSGIGKQVRQESVHI